MARNLSAHIDQWEIILGDDGNVKQWVSSGVHVLAFFKHFRGSSEGFITIVLLHYYILENAKIAVI